MIAALIMAVAVAALPDPADEARARALEQEIRCVACENEPIAQSNSEIAQDMRVEVRERIAAGETDSQIRASFRERYGDFVLFRPPMDGRTWFLWLAPGLLLLAGGAGLLLMRRKSPAIGEADLAPDESER